MFTLKLSTPLNYGDGKTKITELKFDFDKLTGQDIIDCENEARSFNNILLYPEGDAGYLATLAAKAAGVNTIIIKDLPAKDFYIVKSKARNFINASLGINPENLIK